MACPARGEELLVEVILGEYMVASLLPTLLLNEAAHSISIIQCILTPPFVP